MHLVIITLMIFYIGLIPTYKSQRACMSELFNEWMLLVASYHMAVFANGRVIEAQRFYQNTMIVTLIILIGVNGLIILRKAY